MEVRLLLPGDDRSEFECGEPALDRYFRDYAGQNQFRHYLGANYVALESARIVGFATVSSAQIESAALPQSVVRRLPRYPLPVLRLARLATDRSAQGRGVGLQLLRYVLNLAVSQSRAVGCVGVLVDAKRVAVPFYANYGFTALSEDSGDARAGIVPMFIAMATIVRATASR